MPVLISTAASRCRSSAVCAERACRPVSAGAAGRLCAGHDVTLFGVGKIRAAAESYGMMQLRKELNMSDSHDGIIDLPEDAACWNLVCRLRPSRRPHDRDQPDAEPSGLHLDLRHRPRPGRFRLR